MVDARSALQEPVVPSQLHRKRRPCDGRFLVVVRVNLVLPEGVHPRVRYLDLGPR